MCTHTFLHARAFIYTGGCILAPKTSGGCFGRIYLEGYGAGSLAGPQCSTGDFLLSWKKGLSRWSTSWPERVSQVPQETVQVQGVKTQVRQAQGPLWLQSHKGQYVL